MKGHRGVEAVATVRVGAVATAVRVAAVAAAALGMATAGAGCGLFDDDEPRDLGVLAPLAEPEAYCRLTQYRWVSEMRWHVSEVFPDADTITDPEVFMKAFVGAPGPADDALLVVAAYGLERVGTVAHAKRLGEWLDNYLLSHVVWAPDAVTEAIAAILGIPASDDSYTWTLKEKLAAIDEAAAATDGDGHTRYRSSALKACAKPGQNTVHTITFEGTDPKSKQPATVSIDVIEAARDWNLSNPKEKAIYDKRVQEDDDAYALYEKITPTWFPDGYSRRANCAGTAIRWIVSRDGRMPNNIDMPPFLADDGHIRKLMEGLGEEIDASQAEPGTIINHGEPPGSTEHFEIVVDKRADPATGRTMLVVWGKDNQGHLREHLVDPDDPFPSGDQIRISHPNWRQRYWRMPSITKIVDPDACSAPSGEDATTGRDDGAPYDVSPPPDPGKEVEECPKYECVTGGCGAQECCIQGFYCSTDTIACEQEVCPEHSGRTYTLECCCNCWDDQTYVNVYDPCRPGFLLRCDLRQ